MSEYEVELTVKRKGLLKAKTIFKSKRAASRTDVDKLERIIAGLPKEE